MLPLTSIPSQDQRAKWSDLAVCYCCWLVCGGGICFFIDGNVILDGPEFARGGDILGGREIGYNLEVCLFFKKLF